MTYTEPFRSHRDAALALLNANVRMTRKAGSLCGQLAVDPTPMTPSQRGWFDILLQRASLPPLIGEVGHE